MRDTATPEDWPFPADEFVRASGLLEATDQEVRRAVELVEDGGSE